MAANSMAANSTVTNSTAMNLAANLTAANLTAVFPMVTSVMTLAATSTAVSSSSVPITLTKTIPKFVQSHVDTKGPLPCSFEQGPLTDQQRENHIDDLVKGIIKNITILSQHYLIESVWFGQT